MNKNKFLNRNFYVNIATVFGLGFHSSMPGTLGSFVAMLVCFVIDIPLWAIVGVSLLGVWSTALTEKLLDGSEPCPVRANCSVKNLRCKKDPRCTVIDEVAGMWCTVYLLPKNFLVGGFFLFRLLDILKPFPINRMEKFHGGWGIMLDDIVGGIIGNVILQAINAYFFRSGWLFGLIQNF